MKAEEPFFLDTCGILSAMDEKDPTHAEAARLLRTPGKKLVHSLVFAEVVASSTTRSDLKHLRRVAINEVFRLMEDDPDVEVILVSDELLKECLLLLRDRFQDKEWSLCDMVTIELMRRRHITRVLTRDEDFRQAGFQRLLCSD